MENNKRNQDAGISIFISLTILFICLKLFGAIHWDWFWVVSPILIPIVLFLGFLVVSFIVVAVATFFERSKKD